MLLLLVAASKKNDTTTVFHVFRSRDNIRNGQLNLYVVHNLQSKLTRYLLIYLA